MPITTPETLEEARQSRPGALIYISSQTCNVCHALKPKVFDAFASAYPKLARFEIDATATPELAASMQVFAAPTVIIFLDGQEVVRKSRAFGVDELLQSIERPYRIFTS